jgi:tetratricopeptide (TPR) repeat protein
MQEAKGAIYKPTGPVEQHIGDRITQIVQSSEELPVPRIQAPPQDFTGREEELEKLLSRFDLGATITGLRGMGGIGKTALALVLAERLKSRFGDGQIFLKLDGTSPNPLKPIDAMAQVVRAFRGSAERLPENQYELQRLYNSVLEGKKVLLFLDNAVDREQVKMLLPPKGCAAIVTSRKKFTLPGMPEPFLLDKLKPSEARDLLLKICPRIGSHADDLAKLCGYLPLALRASASLLAVKSDLNPESYLEELRSERTRLEMIGKEGVDLDVDASFNLSYSRLRTEMASVFCKLSIFPSDFDAAAEEAICQDQSHTQLSNLVTWSLVEFEEETGRYSLHDLVQLFAARLLEERDKEVARSAALRHAEYYKVVLYSATEFYLHGGKDLLDGLRKFDLERMNIDAGWAWTKENFKDDNAAASLCSAYLDWPYLFELRLHPKERISWLETALAAARQLKDKNMEGTHLGNLGNAYAYLGDAKKAIEYYEQCLTVHREIGDRKGEGNDLGNLGVAYKDLGETRKAIEYYERALTLDREIGDRRGEGNDLGNLGNAYVDLRDAKKAIEYHEQCLTIHREIGDKRGEGNALGNLGVAYRDLGDTKKAIEFYERALARNREIGNRLGEGNDLGNLGVAYADLGDTKKAIEFYDKQLVIGREIGNRKGEGNALWNMSLSLDKLGQRTEAIDCARSALKIFEQIESPNAERVRQQLAEWQK